MLTLSVERRAQDSKVPAIRASGKVPAVFYGRKEQSTPITVSAAEFLKVWRQAGESSVIILKEGQNEHQALIKDVDLDPVTSIVRHADFYVIEKGKKLQVSVPLNFIGVSAAIKELGGILVKVMHELKIEALPKDLPTSVDVDISALTTFESQILAKDLKLPEGVVLIVGADDVVASVAQPVEEKEEVPEAIDLSAIEVEKKGKKEEEGAVEGAADATSGKAPAAKEDKAGKEAKK